MVAKNTVRTHGVNRLFRFVNGMWLRCVIKFYIFFGKVIFHTCTTCSELPSFIRTINIIMLHSLLALRVQLWTDRSHWMVHQNTLRVGEFKTFNLTCSMRHLLTSNLSYNLKRFSGISNASPFTKWSLILSASEVSARFLTFKKFALTFDSLSRSPLQTVKSKYTTLFKDTCIF